MAERRDRKRRGSPEWIRLGELLAHRRGELNVRYEGHGGRTAFVEDRGINLKLIQELENNGRENFTPVKLRDEVAPAYSVEYASIRAVLDGGGDLVALPGTPPHKPREREGRAGRQGRDDLLPLVASMLDAPGIEKKRAEVDAERDGGRFVARDEDELRIWANPGYPEDVKRTMVSYRRLVWDQAVRSAQENAGLLRGSNAGL